MCCVVSCHVVSCHVMSCYVIPVSEHIWSGTLDCVHFFEDRISSLVASVSLGLVHFFLPSRDPKVAVINTKSSSCVSGRFREECCLSLQVFIMLFNLSL